MWPLRLAHRSGQAHVRWITDDLGIAAVAAARDWRRLEDEHVRAALDLCTIEEGGGAGPHRPNIAYRWFPIPDGTAPSLEDLREVSYWTADRLRSGRALINCREGRGRSALLACATLMQLGYSLESAYQVVRRGQPFVALSDDQVMVLEVLSRA